MRILWRCIAVLAMIWLPVEAGANNENGMSAGSPCRIIPVPEKVETKGGVFSLPERVRYSVRGHISAGLSGYMESLPLKLLPADSHKAAELVIIMKGAAVSRKESAEAYRLTVMPRRIEIEASTEAGIFYGIQSLLQMTGYGKARRLQCCTVTDSPRFPYRGLHFDVSRHFRSKEFLMKQMDAMAMLKLNTMHLHLTNGAGWRIAVAAYPKLTDFAAWRPQKRWTDWAKEGTLYCENTVPSAYGGYYTPEDIREILAYARVRHINVIPEIGMPGHSEEVLAAYPELSCSGKPYVNSDYCIGKEATFRFLETVLSEVMALFPSEYIHIGGDEAAKNGWKDCPDCQRRMKEEGLEDVDALQSYFIRRIESFVNSKGRKIIGFDEIMQGGLAPNATVMSWRDDRYAVEAARSGHDVVMTPIEYYYLDYTQDAPFKEPVSIGGYTPLRAVYSYNPPTEGLSAAEAAHVIGVQGNLWSEYVTDDSHAEYMYYPRAFAVAETAWSRQENKDYDRFRADAIRLCESFGDLGFATFDLAHEYGERKESLEPVSHLGRGCKVTYNIPYSEKWPGSGDTTLTDGLLGGWTYRDMKWQGTLDDLDVTIDLGRVQPVRYVGASFMHSVSSWVHAPEKVEVFLSEDGEHYALVRTVWDDIPSDDPNLLFKLYSAVCSGTARYVRLHAVRNGRPGSWLFTDEIIVN